MQSLGIEFVTEVEEQTPEEIEEALQKASLELEEQSRILKECQTGKTLESCFACVSLLDCQTRRAYVSAVYNSMSVGSEGDFDF